MENTTRRQFLRDLAILGAGLVFPKKVAGLEGIIVPPSPEYENIHYDDPKWHEISQGLEFSRVEIHRGNKLVDAIAALRIDPQHNELKVFTSYGGLDAKGKYDIEGWQRKLHALALFNSAQYMGDPWGMPCGLALRRGTQLGPKYNESVKGMLVAEPKDPNLPLVDLLDFEYDHFDPNTTQYTEGVQHWPILLDRKGDIKVKKTNWQANRTVVAKDRDRKILVFTTEGGFFTLYNFGRFLKENSQKRYGFNVHTAMNMDGGYEAEMLVETPVFQYVTFGQYETYGPSNNASVADARISLPTVIGIFPRKK